MIRSLLFLIYIVLALILLIPCLIVSCFVRDKDELGAPSPVGEWALGILLPPIEKIIGIKYEYAGEENIPEGPALYAGNHQSDFDALMIERKLGRFKSAVVKKELGKIPVFNILLDHMHCIIIDRGDIRQSLKCMNLMQRRLEAGQSEIIFPEGTRSKGPDIGEFKAGAFKAAIKAGVPVVPFVIDGSYKLYEAQGYIKSAPVRFSILPPVDTSAPGLKAAELSETVHAMIQAELDRLRAEDAERSDEQVSSFVI